VFLPATSQDTPAAFWFRPDASATIPETCGLTPAALTFIPAAREECVAARVASALLKAARGAALQVTLAR
jgi:hypothetical protein